MKEEWLLHGAVVPVDVETTAALVAEIKRLIDVVGGMVLAQPRLDQSPDYERGFVDGMQKQSQSSVDKAVNAMSQPEQELVQVSPIEFVSLTFGRGHLVGKPAYWAEWPTQEKNT